MVTTPDPIGRLNAALEGRYRIERELGAGGMATVYLADDLRHERRVAIKVLRPELAAIVGADRFLAEIRTTANLQHPHILPLHDSGEADGFLFYVMPYVEGESLRERLDREKQLPVDEAVAIAGKVAGALQAAHERGVIHRDIKPANILLSKGEPLVADFGIALAVSAAGGGRLTETGLSLGTPYYMSPEQAMSDRDPDARSDVYSLACVLYEMLAGDPPHMASTAQAVLTKILTETAPSVTAQRKAVPANVEAALTRGLEKLPADRFRTAAEFAQALRSPVVAVSPQRAAPAGPAPRSTVLAWGIAAVALAALALTLMLRPRAAPDSATPLIRAVLVLDSGQSLGSYSVAISRDGRRVTIGGVADGEMQLFVRDLAESRFVPLAGTVGGELPYFSPDGTTLVFRGGGVMRQIAAGGGPTTVVDADAAWAGGYWAEDGTLYYPRSYVSGLWRKRPDGTPEQLSEPDSVELAHWTPQLLPDGRHLLYTAFRTPIDSAGIAVLDLETGARRMVLRGAVYGHATPTGHLLYARENTIFAIRFDLSSLETIGRPVAVIEDVAMSHVDGLASFAVSENGVAVYATASELDAPADLVWIDRQGASTPTGLEPASYSGPALSPDGRSVAVTVVRPGETHDVWLFDLVRGTRTPLTLGGGADFQPLWTRDGQRILYSSEAPVFDLYWRRADASQPAEPLLQSAYDKYAFSITPDGSRVLLEVSTIPVQSIHAVALDGTATVDTLLDRERELGSPQLSPDGRLLAFTSEQAGRVDVYVVSFPAMTGRQTVSVDGGSEPRWTKAGRELVYRSGRTFFAVAVDPESGQLGRPERLFDAPLVEQQPSRTTYDVTADGERFIMATRPPDRSPGRIYLISDLFAELRRLLPD